VPTIKLLLDRGANPMVADKDGDTALDLAEKLLTPNPDLVNLLKKAEAR
jgi:ankyrin repeat protein